MANDDDSLLSEMVAQIFREFDSILRNAIDGHGGRDRRPVPPERASRPPLIPLYDREVFLPRGEKRKRPRVRCLARAAMEEEQHRVVSIFTANRDPLLDASDPN